MTSDLRGAEQRAYVWIWLPGATEPVVAGVLEARGDLVVFNYGQSYLAGGEAIPLYLPELPLERGRIDPPTNMRVAGCVADAAPDAWGQRVILRRRFGRVGATVDPGDLGIIDYLLESGSDRVGALDFQRSPDTYVPRIGGGSLDELLTAAERLEEGIPFTPELDNVLLHGSSMLGGARPKALVDANGRRLIAKFSSKHDPYPVVKAEAVAMQLAKRVGLNVASTSVVEALGHDVLLVERFDRTAVPGQRRMVVSALTILQLDELFGRYATYHDLAGVIRHRFTSPAATLKELFSRIVFNIAVGNTDDHARNHAAFWHPHEPVSGELTLTPAYDIAPQARSGGEAKQAMAIGPDGFRFSQLAGAIQRADTYLLDRDEARAIVERQLTVIRSEWGVAADSARLTEAERSLLWGRQILNPYALEGF